MPFVLPSFCHGESQVALCFAESLKRKPHLPSLQEMMMDRMDHAARMDPYNSAHFEPPYTRHKYLVYFKPLRIGGVSGARQGADHQVNQWKRQNLQGANHQSHVYTRLLHGKEDGGAFEDDVCFCLCRLCCT
jgi:hypothetical protein